MRRSDSGGAVLTCMTHPCPPPPPLRWWPSARFNIMTLALELRLNSSLIITSELDGEDQQTPIVLLKNMRIVQKCIPPLVLERNAAVLLSEKKPHMLAGTCRERDRKAEAKSRKNQGTISRVEKNRNHSESLECQERSEKKGNGLVWVLLQPRYLSLSHVGFQESNLLSQITSLTEERRCPDSHALIVKSPEQKVDQSRVVCYKRVNAPTCGHGQSAVLISGFSKAKGHNSPTTVRFLDPVPQLFFGKSDFPQGKTQTWDFLYFCGGSFVKCLTKSQNLCSLFKKKKGEKNSKHSTDASAVDRAMPLYGNQ